jgi:hypothetical protein
MQMQMSRTSRGKKRKDTKVRWTGLDRTGRPVVDIFQVGPARYICHEMNQ